MGVNSQAVMCWLSEVYVMKRCIWWSVNYLISTLKIRYLKNKIDLEESHHVMKFYSLF